jgi:hypothetical protein
MKLRYKYLLFNLVWFIATSILVNIILYQTSPSVGFDWSIVLKIEVVFLVITSLFSQVNMSRKTQNEFEYRVGEVLYFWVTLMKVFVIGIIAFGLIHLFVSYETFSLNEYGFVFLIVTTVITTLSRMYLSEM